MIELIISGLSSDANTGAPILVLNDQNRIRALLLWIGPGDALAIANILNGKPQSRPLTHQLYISTLKKVGYSIERVAITHLEEGTYYASIRLTQDLGRRNKRTVEIDCRPSDAVAIALLAKCPIFVNPSVLSESSVAFDTERETREKEAFVQFLESVKASDFKDFKSDPIQPSD